MTENAMKRGGADYLTYFSKIKRGEFTKEHIEEIVQKLKVLPVEGPAASHDFTLDERYIDELIGDINKQEFTCAKESAENFRKFLEILKPTLSQESKTTLPFLKHLIRDIERTLFY